MKFISTITHPHIVLKIKRLLLTICVALLGGCNHNDDNEAIYNCESPVLFSNEPNEVAPGYLVSINSEIDVNLEATRFIEKYKELEVHATFVSCNCFHASSTEETVRELQCESSVIGMEYNNVYSLSDPTGPL